MLFFPRWLAVAVCAVLLSGASYGSASAKQNVSVSTAERLEALSTRVDALEGADARRADPGCGPSEDRRSELCAQWKAADSAAASAFWDQASFWVGIVTTLALGLTLYHSHSALERAREANRIAGLAAINEVRPILTFKGITVRADGHGNWDYQFAFTNSGRGPAYIEEVSQTKRVYLQPNYDPGDRPRPAVRTGTGLDKINSRIVLAGSDLELNTKGVLRSDLLSGGHYEASALVRYSAVFTDENGARGRIYETESVADILPVIQNEWGGGVLEIGVPAEAELVAARGYNVRPAVRLT